MKIKHIETLLDETQLLVEYEDGFEEIFEAKIIPEGKSTCVGCYFIKNKTETIINGRDCLGQGGISILKMKCVPSIRIDKENCIWIKQ